MIPKNSFRLNGVDISNYKQEAGTSVSNTVLMFGALELQLPSLYLTQFRKRLFFWQKSLTLPETF